jgi:hypothetical protein
MKIGYRPLLFAFLFVISPLSVAFPLEGPLQVKNQYPIFLHAGQPYFEKALIEDSFSVSLSHSSTYTVQSSGRWVIHLDMEITEINFRYKWRMKGPVEFGIDIPVLILSGGFMDGFLETYHSTFGLPDYGRSERPLNEFLYEIKRDGVLLVKGRTGTGLGDMRVTIKRPLITSEGLNVSIKGDIEFPTGSVKDGYGNGSMDAGVSVLLDKGVSGSAILYLNLGVVWPGDVRGYERIDLKDFVYGGVALEAMVRENLSLLVQLQGQSPLYPDTDLLAVDRAAYLLSLGGRYYSSGRSRVEFSLTEDINTAGAPDFILNITYKIKL